MSLFRKPKKSIQRRVFTENDDDDEGQSMEAEEAVPSTTDREHKKKQTSKSTTAKKQSLLSFETEEEGEVFQIKKSSHSKRIMKLYEKERQKKKEPKPEKEEVKKEPVTEIVTDDLVMKVNTSHKPPTPPLILSGRDALCAGKDDLSSEEDDGPNIHKFSKPDNVKLVLESGMIPDAAVIHAARKRRQRARELGGDFVPLEDEEPEDTGRLRHEDDQDDVSDEERIDMGANPAIRDQERRREQFLAAQESDQEADQELDEWENQQIRKGVTGAAAVAVTATPNEYVYDNYEADVAIHTAVPAMDPNTQKTPETIVAKLKETFEIVQMSRKKHMQQKQRVQDELTQVTKELEDLKVKAPVAAERFRFYQELRAYITDLVECLDEKVGLITDLEQRALNLMEHKAEWLVERRRQDVRDQAEELTNLGKASGRRGTEDEDKTRRAAEREGRRSRRRRAREQQGHPKHVEGMSSDDEVTQQDTLNFDKEREQIETEAQQIFEDVVEEYSSITNILIRFEQWRETDMSTYTEAYATMCLPRVVAPLIRLNLIFWDPLNESVELEKLEWYRTLALYGLHDDETEDSLSQDPDINLLPTIIEKIIIPKLDQFVDRCWDPLSSSQTLRLVGILSRYIRRFPTLGPASKSLQNLFNAVLHKIKSALENDVFIPITLKLSESKSSFFQRQFASGLKLLRNVTCWQGILNDNTLKDLALNSLLNRYLLSAVKVCQLTDAVAKVGLISHILPRIWLQGNIPQLQMFSACVTNLAQQLDKNNPLHLESIETLTNVLKSLRN